MLVLRSMDSEEENDMVERFRESDIGLKGDKGPKYDGKQTSWTAFWYEMKPYLELCKLGETVDGDDRDEKDSLESKVRNGYKRRNLKLWRYLTRAISDKTSEGAALRMKIRADFGENYDGYELVIWLKGYANDQTHADVKKLKKDLTKITF